MSNENKKIEIEKEATDFLEAIIDVQMDITELSLPNGIPLRPIIIGTRLKSMANKNKL